MSPSSSFLLRWLWILAFPLVLLLAHCANPVPPSGGPRDRTPPSLQFSEPRRGAVNVPADTRTVRLAFSEYVDRASLAQSLTVTPALEGRLEFDWDGQEVAIELPEALRDSTTYIFTFDTNLSDTRNVALKEPLTLAFSTGPRISQGELRGRVVSPAQGTPLSRVDVYAYVLGPNATRPPTPLPERPSYRTQSGEEGDFQFEYLREQAYFVVAVRDVNRNRVLDASEPRALPPRLRLIARPDAPAPNVPWVLAPLDTTAPRVERVRPLTAQRLEVRFTEPVRLDTFRTDGWSLRNTNSDAAVPVDALYVPPGAGPVVRMRTGPMRPAPHRLQVPSGLVRDTLGQPLADTTVGLDAVDTPDTLGTRFLGFRPPLDAPDSTGAYPLPPKTLPGVRFNQPPDSSLLRRVLSLHDDSTNGNRPFSLQTSDGVTFRLAPQPALGPGEFITLSVRQRPLTGRDTVRSRRFRRVTRRALGDLEGEAVLPEDLTQPSSPTPDSLQPDSLQPDSAQIRSAQIGSAPSDSLGGLTLVVEAYPQDVDLPVERQRITVAPESTFVFRSLPEGTFRFRAFLDRDGDRMWDAGTLAPYTPPERITWSEDVTESRPRWTTVLSAPLQFPRLRPPAAPDSQAPADTAAVLDTTAVPGE